jgi:hypothetical protein
MGYTELIEKLQALPQDKQAEVFDFVEFLVARFGTSADQSEWTRTEFAEFAFGQALRGLEEDTVIYTADDVRERW